MDEQGIVSGRVAEYLLQIKAIRLQPQSPFRWASGRLAPIYCDNRIILSHPEVRDYVKQHLAQAVTRSFGKKLKPDAIAGVPTSGIAFGALAADELRLPFIYVRPSAKEHGTGRLVEGELEKGRKVVVIEDLISTGKSILGAVDILRKEGITVTGLAAIFTYGFDEAAGAFGEADCPFVTLTDYETLILKALQMEYIGPDMLVSLKQWRKDSEGWGKDRGQGIGDRS